MWVSWIWIYYIKKKSTSEDLVITLVLLHMLPAHQCWSVDGTEEIFRERFTLIRGSSNFSCGIF